jgi:hypothetical protein
MRFLKVISTAAFCVALASGVYATATSDKGLGLYDSPWFIDGLQSYVDDNPSYLGSFKDRAFFERTSVTGLKDGQNMAGLFYSPAGGVTLGMYYGKPVSTSVWNSTDNTGLFHTGNYVPVSKNKRKHSTATSQSLGAYQEEMLNGSIIDLIDPVDGSALVGTQTSSPSNRELLYQRNVSLLASYDLSSISFGLTGGYATSWNNVRSGSGNDYDEFNLVNTEYDAGAGMKIKINEKVEADFAGNWTMYQLDNTYKKSQTGGYLTKLSYKSNGAMDFGGQARLGYQMTQTHKSHFFVKYEVLNRSTQGSMNVSDPDWDSGTATTNYNVNAKDTFNRKGQKAVGGVSDEIKVNDSMKAYIGFMVEYTTFKNNYSGKDQITPVNNLNKYSYSSKSVSVPLVIGLESKLSDNWTGRCSGVQKIYKPFSKSGKTETVNSTSTGGNSIPSNINENSSSETTLSIGLSYKLGNFTFDWLANVDMFVQGPYVVSGKGYASSTDNNPMSMSFATTYSFE